MTAGVFYIYDCNPVPGPPFSSFISSLLRLLPRWSLGDRHHLPKLEKSVKSEQIDLGHGCDAERT